MSLLNFYKKAKEYCIRKGYQKEIDMVGSRVFDDQTPDDLLREYVFVVCNSGMKNQVAQGIFNNYMVYGVSAIKHPGKHDAVERAEAEYKQWFEHLQHSACRITYLVSLPFIGNITKYHLARNLGIDVAKPDRHLTRLAIIFHYDDVQEMCKYLSDKTGDRIGTVDVVLWRYCVLVPSYFQTADLCENHCVGQDDYYCDESICPYVPGDD